MWSLIFTLVDLKIYARVQEYSRGQQLAAESVDFRKVIQKKLALFGQLSVNLERLFEHLKTLIPFSNVIQRVLLSSASFIFLHAFSAVIVSVLRALNTVFFWCFHSYCLRAFVANTIVWNYILCSKYKYTLMPWSRKNFPLEKFLDWIESLSARLWDP